MSGISKHVVFSVARIRCTFSGAGGRSFIATGTGFWTATRPGVRAFVTNRHVLDGEGVSLTGVEIGLRHIEGNVAYPETHFFPVANLSASLRVHSDADCAALVGAEFDCPPEFVDQPPIALGEIADQGFLNDSVQIMDFASFIGFPGRDTPWWDERATLPIARIATVASAPDTSFVNSAIQSKDIVLVSGLSFSGSSGSPVFLHRKGFRTEPPLYSDFVPAKLLGIMSGHRNEPGPTPDMLQHTGLSYFTRSTSILDVLA
jgi:hypothetical protein